MLLCEVKTIFLCVVFRVSLQKRALSHGLPCLNTDDDDDEDDDDDDDDDDFCVSSIYSPYL